jgi:squalene monooxygenase
VVGVQYKVLDQEVAEGQEREVRVVHAPLTIVADGIWSSLRKEVDAGAKPHMVSTFVGLVMEHPPMESPLPVRGCGHVVLGEPSPILLYQISSTETRVLVSPMNSLPVMLFPLGGDDHRSGPCMRTLWLSLVDMLLITACKAPNALTASPPPHATHTQVDIAGKMPSAATGELQKYLREQTAPQLPSGVQPAFLRAVDKGSFKSMPNRSLPRARIDKDGVMLLGDALNMRHPLTGGGMTVAIRDVETAVGLLTDTDVRDHAAMRRLKATFVARRREYAATINVLANALHSVFSTPGMDPTRKDLRDACFDYLSMGGCFAAGPIGLLSGLTPKPSVLATHFFMVALYGVQRYLRPFPTPRGLRRMYDVLHVACSIIMPLLEKEQSTVLSWWPCRTLINLIFPFRQALTEA